MDKKHLISLSKIDSSNVAFALSGRMKNIGVDDNLHLKSIVAAYILFKSDVDENTELDSAENFINSCSMPDDVKCIIKKYIGVVWNVVIELKGTYSVDQLLSFILFNNDLEEVKSAECSTPNGLVKLASSILEIKKEDKVLELCSGKGNFFVETYLMQDEFAYTGIELNFRANEVAQIRASIIEKNTSIILGDALEYRSETKADKLFANYPFMLKTPYMDSYKEDLAKSFDLQKDFVKRVSSDWVFNATIINQIKDNGKAVAIMTNGSTWNDSDKQIRKYFIENGFVETVIALPARLFNTFGIPTTMIVFSKHNEKIKLVDARDIYLKERKNNVLTDDCITKILDLIKQDSKKSITISISDFAEKEYVLNASRYLDYVPEIKNGVELDSVTTNITRGAQIKAADLDEVKSTEPTPFKYSTLSNVNDGLISIDEQYLKEIPSNLEKFCVKNNSIIITKTGTPEVKTAVAQIEEDTLLLATGNLFIIELDEKKINPFFLQAFFSSEIGASSLRNICAGSVLPTISLSKLKTLTIPCPSIDKQKIIADKYAATADEIVLLKRRLKKNIAKMKTLYDEEAEPC